MHREPPLVLIAGVSLHERRIVELTLKKTSFTTLAVDDAEDAAGSSPRRERGACS